MLLRIALALCAQAEAPPYPLPALQAPQAELVELGAALFASRELSADRSVACASCHQAEHGFADTAPTSLGVNGQRTLRNTPTILNRAYGASFFWDGRAPTLEQQVLAPIVDPREMGLALTELLARLGADGQWSAAFRKADVELDEHGVSSALAAFVRTRWIGDSPVDRFRQARADLLSDDERAGLWIYESSGGCWRCHSGPNFSDEQFHNTGVGVRDGVIEAGRMDVTRAVSDRGAFKTPTLRGVALTAPYMHDGSLATLEDVIEFYRRGCTPNENLDARLDAVRLEPGDTALLVAFLRALSRAAPPR